MSSLSHCHYQRDCCRSSPVLTYTRELCPHDRGGTKRLSAGKGPKVSATVYMGNISQSLGQLCIPETPVGGTVWGGLGGAAWMGDEELRYWGQALKDKTLINSWFALSALCLWEGMGTHSSLLQSRCLLLTAIPPHMMGSCCSETLNPNKLFFFKVPWPWCFIRAIEKVAKTVFR